MNYRCISADCHLDLSWLPPDLFTSNASRDVLDFMPRIVDGDDGRKWVNKQGGQFGFVCGMGSFGRKYVPGMISRADRMAATGLYGDESRTSRRVTDPQQRIKDQDRDGVQAEVLYGILGAVNRVNDARAAAEMSRIYNEWLVDFCKAYPERLIGLGVIAGNNVEAALAETKKLIQGGIRGVEMSMSGNAIPLFEQQWDPLWRMLSDAGLPIHLHITPPIPPANAPHWTHREQRSANALMVTKMPLAAVDHLVSMIFGGALERFPKLCMVFAETGLSWIPYVLDRMDYQWEEQYQDILPMKPSDYWRRQCKATFQFDATGLRLIDILGANSLMWGSDFPHPDGVWPDSQMYIDKQFGGLPDEVRRQIVCGNAAALYGLKM